MSGIIVYCRRRMVGRLRMSMLATLFGSNLSRDQPKSQHSTACNFVFLDLNIGCFSDQKKVVVILGKISAFATQRKKNQYQTRFLHQKFSRIQVVRMHSQTPELVFLECLLLLDTRQRNFQEFRSEKQPISPIE